MKKEQLKVHVLNAYGGDSILIEFPHNIWGVVDSNRKHKNAPIPALEFLKKMEKLNRLDKIRGKTGDFMTIFPASNSCHRKPRRCLGEWLDYGL